jgi:hypothetical protein
MKNKILLIGLAVVFALSMSFVSCAEEDGGDSSSGTSNVVTNKPDAPKNIQTKTYPGVTLVYWDHVTNAAEILIYRTGADKVDVLLDTLGGNETYYLDKITSNASSGHAEWEPGQTYTYKIVTRNDPAAGSATASAKSKAVTMDSMAKGSLDFTKWLQDNTAVVYGTPYRTSPYTLSPILPDHFPITIKDIHPLVTYRVWVMQSATTFDNTISNPTAGTGAGNTISNSTISGTTYAYTTYNFTDDKPNLHIDETIEVKINTAGNQWIESAYRRIIVQFVSNGSPFPIATVQGAAAFSTGDYKAFPVEPITLPTQ